MISSQFKRCRQKTTFGRIKKHSQTFERPQRGFISHEKTPTAIKKKNLIRKIYFLNHLRNSIPC